jgi:hypothetical protein
VSDSDQGLIIEIVLSVGMAKPWEEMTEEEKAAKWEEWDQIIEKNDEEDWIPLKELDED